MMMMITIIILQKNNILPIATKMAGSRKRNQAMDCRFPRQ